MGHLRHRFAIGCGRVVAKGLRMLGRQASTLPGKITLRINPRSLHQQAKGRHIVMVSGTNGKTTTTSVLARLLETGLGEGQRVLSNEFGANLASGMMTTMLYSQAGDYVVLECDEAAFARHAAAIAPKAVVLTNIFRDQLDRFGELDTVLRLLKEGSLSTGSECQLILCADDPNVASIGNTVEDRSHYFAADGEAFVNLEDKNSPHQTDSAHCPLCGHNLLYNWRSMNHLGDFRCSHCDYKRPEVDMVFRRQARDKQLAINFRHDHAADPSNEYIDFTPNTWIDSFWPLDGLYNAYNAAAAILAARVILPGITEAQLHKGLSRVKPAFGRLERIPYKGRELCFVLVKNPAGMEQGIRLVSEAEDAAAVIFFLNNRVNDGVDVSWIWDAPFEHFELPTIPLGASGDRAGDMALRLDYAFGPKHQIETSTDGPGLVMKFLEACPEGKTVYLLPNYSAMMDLRQALAEPLQYKKLISKE